MVAVGLEIPLLEADPKDFDPSSDEIFHSQGKQGDIEFNQDLDLSSFLEQDNFKSFEKSTNTQSRLKKILENKPFTTTKKSSERKVAHKLMKQHSFQIKTKPQEPPRYSIRDSYGILLRYHFKT